MIIINNQRILYKYCGNSSQTHFFLSWIFTDFQIRFEKINGENFKRPIHLYINRRGARKVFVFNTFFIFARLKWIILWLTSDHQVLICTFHYPWAAFPLIFHWLLTKNKNKKQIGTSQKEIIASWKYFFSTFKIFLNTISKIKMEIFKIYLIL